jgi:two-component system response regulator (stage 0 sporulation protein A)
MSDQNVIVRVVSTLEKLGVPKNVLGYLYLRKAIMLAYLDFSCVGAITTKIYPVIAKEHETTPPRVERCMRHAIEVAYHSGSEEMEGIFKFSPNNGLFIAEIADRLRVEDGII